MIPLRDVIPSRTPPVVTVGLIVANSLVFLYQVSLPETQLQGFVKEFGLVPAEFALSSLVTSMFLHGGWLHVVGNMWYLWIFGDNVEDRMGHGRFLVFYLLCGVAAGARRTWWSASIAGAHHRRQRRHRRSHGRLLRALPAVADPDAVPIILFIQIVEMPALFFLLGVLVHHSAVQRRRTCARGSSHVGGVAFWAHIAGFAAGLVLVWPFRRRERSGPTGGTDWRRPHAPRRRLLHLRTRLRPRLA